MHFQIKTDAIYIRIPQLIKEYFPDFTSLFEEDDGAYIVFGELLTYLDSNDNKKIYINLLSLVNFLGINGGNNTIEMLTIELYDYFEGNKNDLYYYLKENLEHEVKIKLEGVFVE